MKLDLQEIETAAALILAAVVADQVADNIGTQTVVFGIGPEALRLTITDALGPADARRFHEVFVTHLEKQLGQGFVVESEAGEVLVRLDLAGGEEGDDDGVVAEAPKKRRGRPPGSKNKPTAPETSE